MHLGPGGQLAGEEKVLEPAEPLGQVGKLLCALNVEELREELRPDVPVPPPGKLMSWLAVLVIRFFRGSIQ